MKKKLKKENDYWPVKKVECQIPQDISITFSPFKASMTVGDFRWSVSPCPSCPYLNK